MPKSHRPLTSTNSHASTTRRNRHIRPSVVFHPNLLDGINVIAEAVKPTLGPLPRFVGIESMTRDRPPELLDDAATIARRVIQIADPTADVGAMMMRHALWRMHETCGDGSATMATIAQTLAQQATKAIAAGAHPALLRKGIERGVAQASADLRAGAVRPMSGRRSRELLAALARSVCHDAELRDVLVEIVDILGADGAIQVVNNDARRVDREYIEGAMWDSPWLTTGFATDAAQSIARISDAAVILLDGKLDSAVNVLEGLKRLYSLGHRNVLIIAGDLSDEAKTVLIQAKLSGVMSILPVKAPGFDAKRAVALQDLAALTGARILLGDAAAFASLAPEDVGSVRRAWATARQFGIIGGKRDPVALRNSIASVRRKIDDTLNLDEIAELRMRLGRLCGGLAIVRVGGATSKIQESRRDEAVRLSRTLQMAAGRGYVAGGGAALFKIAQALLNDAERSNGRSDDVAFGVRCLARALESPLMTIAANAGFNPSEVAGQVRAALRADPHACHGFDARSGCVVDMMAAGIVDSTEVIERAVRVAGSLAVTAITTDAVVHHRKPALATNP
ncbi:MAG: TCP-1/cpn60 chaperonin family protein [Candidatus Brachytrichaceae bacterium NZ_4S206]